MMKPLRLALALATLLCVSTAYAQSTKEAPAGSGQRYQGTILIDPSTGNGYAAGGGGGGGSAADQTGSNATDSQATRTDNQHSNVYNYIFNGTQWDRARGTGGAANVNVQNFPTGFTEAQGSPAAVANAWPFFLTQGGAVLSGTNGLPTTDTNAASTITAPGTASSKTQSIQGAPGGIAVGVSEADGANAAIGAKADTAYAGSGAASVVAALKGIYTALLAPTPAGSNNIGIVTPSVGTAASAPSRSAETGSSLAADGIVPVVTQAGTSAVGKAAAGNLYSAYAVNGTATAGFLACINATAAPAASAAITPIDVAAIAGSAGATGQINFGAGPGNVYSTGITCLVTTSLTTYTAGGNAFIQVRVR